MSFSGLGFGGGGWWVFSSSKKIRLTHKCNVNFEFVRVHAPAQKMKVPLIKKLFDKWRAGGTLFTTV